SSERADSPTRTRSGPPAKPPTRCSAASSGLEPLELDDDLLHDLARPAADGDEANVAPRPRHRGLVDVTHPAVVLLARVGNAMGEVDGEELGNADLLLRVEAGDEEGGRVVGEEFRRLDRRQVLGEAMAPDLEADEGSAERLTLAGVVDRVLEH